MLTLNRKAAAIATGVSVAIVSLLGISTGNALADGVNDHFSSGFKGEGGSSDF